MIKHPGLVWYKVNVVPPHGFQAFTLDGRPYFHVALLFVVPALHIGAMYTWKAVLKKPKKWIYKWAKDGQRMFPELVAIEHTSHKEFQVAHRKILWGWDWCQQFAVDHLSGKKNSDSFQNLEQHLSVAHCLKFGSILQFQIIWLVFWPSR